MRFLGIQWVLCLAGLSVVLKAQAPTAPVVQPRGVVNAFTQLPAPAVVGQGGLLHINGINLGPANGWKATTLPLPTSFGEPAVEVLINNRPIPLIEATSSRIVAQVPLETAAGLAAVIVRRGEQQSRPVRVQVQNLVPSVQAANGKGFGVAASQSGEGILKLSLSSMGATDPRVPSGEAATDLTVARAPIRVYVGGIEAESRVSYSKTSPGEFVLDLKVPATAVPGDLVVVAANAFEANPLLIDKGPASAEVIFIPFPEGTPELRILRSSDLDGMFLNANSTRGPDTCFTSFQVDARRKVMSKVDGCLTTAQPQAITPFIEGASSNVFAAFEGPFKGTVQQGQPTLVGDRIRIFRSGAEQPITASLPEPVANLNSQPGGDFVATVPGVAGVAARSYRIDSQSGAVEEFTPVAGGAAAGPVNLQGLVQRFQNLDLGDGVNNLLSPVSQANNQIVLTIGDSIENPTKARVAVLNLQGEVLAQRTFPEGWLPVVAPAPQQAQPPAGTPNAPGLRRTPTPVYLDAQTRSYFVAVRNPDGLHGLAHFPTEGEAQIIALPENWFFTACLPNIPVFNLELARGIALLGSSSDDRSFKNPCPAEGFLLFDLAQRRFQAVSLPGSGKFNASGGADEINDFLIGSNFDPANRNTSDTFYALDSVNATALRFDLPAGVNGFSGAVRIPALNQVIAQANNRIPGDAGLVVFDLERTEARLLPTPEGFVNINFLGVLPSLRKLVARGIRSGNTGSQILIYNLENGDLEMVPNPEGVSWIGSPIQQQPGQPGQQGVQLPARLNLKTNSLEAIVFGEDRRQKGVAIIRVN